MTGAHRVVLDCSSIHSDLASVDHVARLHLGLKRGGCELCLAEPNEELLALLALAVVGVGGAGVLVRRPSPGALDSRWIDRHRKPGPALRSAPLERA